MTHYDFVPINYLGGGMTISRGGGIHEGWGSPYLQRCLPT